MIYIKNLLINLIKNARMQLFFDMYTRVCVVMMIMPGMMETTGIGRFIKLSTATVYTVSGKIFII